MYVHAPCVISGRIGREMKTKDRAEKNVRWLADKRGPRLTFSRFSIANARYIRRPLAYTLLATYYSFFLLFFQCSSHAAREQPGSGGHRSFFSLLFHSFFFFFVALLRGDPLPWTVDSGAIKVPFSRRLAIIESHKYNEATV